jgi:hypothetical protein
LLLAVAASPAGAQALAPSNLPESTCVVAGQSNLVLTGSSTLDTNSACHSIVDQGGGTPEVCVMKFADVHVGPAAILSVGGVRALALVATGLMTIEGRIDAAANGAMNGPGITMSGVGQTGTTTSGGGGAGHGTSGAQGGANVGSVPASGGAMSGTPMLVPLQGGSQGGAGGTGAVGSAARGGGGGAVQLVSCTTLSVAMGGVVEAGGGGGSRALATAGGTGGGGGGGSGGGILLEALDVAVHGTLAANGGGGGEGASPTSSGMSGADGASSLATAPGGSGGSIGGGDGGHGATSLVAAGPGNGGSGTASSGGGGGAVGRIRINVPPTGSLDLAGAVITPTQMTGTAGLTDLIFGDGFE